MPVYSPSLDVLFGGLITFFVALVGVALERRWSKKQRDAERLERLAALGFSIQMKIASAYGWSKSVSRSIDECFADAAAGSGASLDPGVKVKPLIGARAPSENFSADELTLLLETGDNGLAEALMAFHWRIMTTGRLVEEFNSARTQLSHFLSNRMLEGRFLDEQTGRVALPASLQHAVDAQVASLNGLVGEFLTELPALMLQARGLMARVETSLSSIHGLRVRKVGFQV